MINKQKKTKLVILISLFLIIVTIGIFFLFRGEEESILGEMTYEDFTKDIEVLKSSYCLEGEILSKKSHNKEEGKGFNWIDEDGSSRTIFGEEYFLRSDVMIRDDLEEDIENTIPIDEKDSEVFFLSSGCGSKILSYLEENFTKNIENSDKNYYLLGYENGDIKCKYRHIHGEEINNRALLECGDIKKSTLIEERETDVVREEMKEIMEDLKRIQEILMEREAEE